MGNPQHLEWLLEGAEMWNARREREPFKPDLSKMDVREVFEREKRFARRPKGTQRSNLVRYNLANADFSESNLEMSDLDGADMSDCILTGTNLQSSNLWGTVLVRAFLSETLLEDARLAGVDLSGATLSNLNLKGLDMGAARVETLRSVTEKAYYPTVFEKVSGLTQRQLNLMRGDSWTLFPDGLKRPAHWPVFEPDDFHDPGHRKSRHVEQPETGFQLAVSQRPVSEIRRALNEDYGAPAALAGYMVDQLQREIAAHKSAPIPNDDPEKINAYVDRLNFLVEMRTAVLLLHEYLPTAMPETFTDRDAVALKEILLSLAKKVDAAIRWLDSDPGSYGNFWKLGLIAMGVKLLGLCGITAPEVAAPIATGVIGVNAVRVLLTRER